VAHEALDDDQAELDHIDPYWEGCVWYRETDLDLLREKQQLGEEIRMIMLGDFKRRESLGLLCAR
jgi:hypothetical protein